MMRILKIYSAMAAFSLAVFAAQADEPWQDPAVNELNRLPARAFAPPLASEEAALSGALEPETPYVLSLDGTWKFDWVGSPAQRPLDFWRTDFDESSFGEIDVPSCVEMRGHGIPHYSNCPYPFRKDPPRIDDEYNSVSSYRRTFTIPSGWEGRRVILRFEGVGSAFFVWVNGRKVGYGEDSYLPSEFDITEYVREQGRGNREEGTGNGENVLAVQVFHWCDGSYLEDQDMFRFSGIFRSVKLVAEPTDGIWDFRVETELSSDFASAKLAVSGLDGDWSATLYDVARRPVANLSSTHPSSLIPHPSLWSAEDPYLYTLVIRRGADIRSCEVGFRDVRIDGVRFLVNGRPMKFRGVNRHESSPRNGRTLTAEEMVRDVVMMKRANIDTVRTAHYPDDPRWYRLCDRYGIYLVAEADVEAHGMGYKEEGLGDKPEWRRSIVERNERHVRAYRNHPSVIMWSLGNETGPGPNFVAARDAVRALDGTRPVHYERQSDDMDVDATMYKPIEWLRDYKEKGKPLFVSEYAHAMGNALGEFERYWDTYLSREVFAGGCIWDWIDQAVWQVTERGEPYLAYGGDWDETPHQYNFCCNGLITPDRAWTPKLEHVRWVHRQLAVTRRDGRLWLQNRFAFTSADAFDGTWRLLSDGREIASGAFDVPAVAPGGTGRLEGLERSVAAAAAAATGEVLLNVSFTLRTATAWAERGYEIARDQVAIAGGFRPFAAATGAAHPFEPAFDAKTGELVSLKTGGRELLAGPPRLTCDRAFCDNDWKWLWSGKYPDELGFTASGLNRLTYSLRGRSDVTTGGVRTVRTLYRVQGWRSAGFDHEIVWTFRRDGVLEMRNKVTPFGKMGALPRLGTTWKIAPGLEKLAWYGRGPLENYCDRKGSEFLGLHTGTVTGQYVPYVRPQMCGGKCDVRHVTLADDDGRGVTFAGSVPLFVTALHYSPEDILSARPGRDQSRRVAFKPPRAETWLDLDVGQTGLGNNSCGPMPNAAERYRAVPVEWTVFIRPRGETELDPIFANGMVLAAGKPVRVFGRGPGPVRVTFAGRTVQATAAAGRWCAEFPPAEKGRTYELEADLAGRRVVVRDIGVGEVWLMAGQSNMQMKLRADATDPADYRDNADVRLYSTRRPFEADVFRPTNGWVRCAAATAGNWSAIAYHFGQARQEATQAPVGVVACYQGASVIQSWLPESVAREPRFHVDPEAMFKDHWLPKYRRWNAPGCLYESQFAQVVPFSFTGVVWYQGESNASVAEAAIYPALVKEMVGAWRRDLKDDALPFWLVQIADYDRRTDAGWRGIQAAQAAVPGLVPNVTLIRSADVCETDNIHPRTKVRLARRISDSVDGGSR